MRTLVLVTIILVSIPLLSVSAYSLPPWVKNLSYWYSQGEISDQEFISAIQYLEVSNSSLNLGGYSNATLMFQQYSNATSINPFINGSYSTTPSKQLTLETDKENYTLGSFIIISGRSTPPYPNTNVTINGPDGKVMASVISIEDNSGNYLATIQSNGFTWLTGSYTITASSGTMTATKTISLH